MDGGIGEAKLLIGEDITCVRCRYNLRGLCPDGRCPECCEAISLTLLDQLSRERGGAGTVRLDRASLRRVTEAATMLFVAGAIVAIVSLLPDSLRGWPQRTRHILLAAYCAAFSLHLIGVWKLAGAFETRRGRSHFAHRRPCLRFADAGLSGNDHAGIGLEPSAQSPRIPMGQTNRIFAWVRAGGHAGSS